MQRADWEKVLFPFWTVPHMVISDTELAETYINNFLQSKIQNDEPVPDSVNLIFLRIGSYFGQKMT